MTLEKLYAITHGLNRRFPNGNDPFQIMTRLLEESGELAQMVNSTTGVADCSGEEPEIFRTSNG